MSDTGKRLREARERSGLSARALDKKAEITSGHTTLIESGRRIDPSGETIRKLASALDVSTDWLLTGSERQSTRDLNADESGEHTALNADTLPDLTRASSG